MSSNVLLLKNKTAELDTYETAFKKKNFDPVFIPLINHTHIAEDVLRLFSDSEYLNDLQHIIVTSQRTVECLSESVFPKLDPGKKSMLLGKTVYSVGSTTSAFLTHIGFQDVRGGSNAGNGSILSDIIISDLLSKDNSAAYNELLFLVGEIRRDIIPKKLSAAGLHVKETVVYSTHVLQDTLTKFKFEFKGGCWVVVFSPQGSEDIINFLKEIPTTHYKIASIGPTTEKYLVSMGIKPSIVSPKPDSSSLIKSMICYETKSS